MKIKRVEHIAIAVDSMQQSLELMRDTFGLELEYEEQIGQTRLAMLPVGQTISNCWKGRARNPASRNGSRKRAPACFISVSRSRTSKAPSPN